MPALNGITEEVEEHEILCASSEMLGNWHSLIILACEVTPVAWVYVIGLIALYRVCLGLGLYSRP